MSCSATINHLPININTNKQDLDSDNKSLFIDPSSLTVIEDAVPEESLKKSDKSFNGYSEADALDESGNSSMRGDDSTSQSNSKSSSINKSSGSSSTFDLYRALLPGALNSPKFFSIFQKDEGKIFKDAAAVINDRKYFDLVLLSHRTPWGTMA